MNGDLEKKERFQSLKLSFNNAEIKINNSVYFDVDSEIVKQLGIDVDCKRIDLVELFKRNLSRFKKGIDEKDRDRVDDFIQYPENGSLIYFAEFEELKKRYDEYLSEDEEERVSKISEIVEGIEPVVATVSDISPLIPEVVRGKVVRKTGGAPTRNKRKLADMGLRGEQCVFQLLRKDPKKSDVDWVSENAQKVG